MYRKTIKFANLSPSSDDLVSDDSLPNSAAFPMGTQQEKVDEHPLAASATPQIAPVDIPYFRFTLRGTTVEFRASGPLRKEHFALIRDHLKTYDPNQFVDEDPRN